MKNGWILLAVALFQLGGSFADTSTLQLLHVLTRHGDRSAIVTFPTDVDNAISTWPGSGELTSIGIHQHFRVGQANRKRYDQFLSKEYDANEIYVESTNFNRTIMSAMAHMAGLFGTKLGDMIWSPVPVHTKPLTDPVLYTEFMCPKYAHIYKDVIMKSDPAVLKIMKDNANVLAFLRNKTGLPLETLDDIRYLEDPLFTEKVHNDTHKWASWMNQSLWLTIKQIYDVSTTFYVNTPETQRLCGGLLYGDIVTRMNDKATGKTDPRFKYHHYSAHDTQIIGLLENFGAYNDISPPYAAAVIFELHLRNKEYIVELFYKNDTYLPPVQLEIGKCGTPCRLSWLYDQLDKKVPKDYNAECNFPNPCASSNSAGTARAKRSVPAEETSDSSKVALSLQPANSLLLEQLDAWKTATITVSAMALCFFVLLVVLAGAFVVVVKSHLKKAEKNGAI